MQNCIYSNNLTIESYVYMHIYMHMENSWKKMSKLTKISWMVMSQEIFSLILLCIYIRMSYIENALLTESQKYKYYL